MVRIALLQLPGNGRDQEANLADGVEACRAAAQLGADIALFPEMWNIAYTPCPEDEPGRTVWVGQALNTEGPFVSHFRSLARELGMAIALTYLERWEPRPRNACSIIDRNGEVVLRYSKVHTCDFSWEKALTPGDGFHVAPLDTAKGEVQFGAMICYDREFPESARVLMLKGAEIILTPNACEIDDNRFYQFRTRAFENMVGVAMVNYAGPKRNGRSCAFDGMAYEEDGTPRDMLIVEVGEAPGVYVADFDIEAIRSYRERETWGNAYRRPAAYGLLPSTVVREPFVSRHSRAAIVADVIPPGERLTLESAMPSGGVVFSDGVEADYLAFTSGATVSIGAAPEAAHLVVA